MNSSGKKASRDSEHEFLELVVRYQEKDLTPEELRRLNDSLRDSPERLVEFTRICETSRLVHEAAVAPARKKAKGLSLARVIPWRWSRVEHLGIAALLALFLGLAALLWQQSGDEAVQRDSVARLASVSDDAVFSPNHQLPTEAGSFVCKGWVRLERGNLRIVFHSGASVELEGPAALGVDSPMRAYLEFGRAKVHAPESARDFIVATDGMEVVDLGTRFELEVDPESRESSVVVTEGLVDLHLGSRGTQRRIQPLEAGWEAQVDESGEILNLEERPDHRPDSDPKIDSPLLAHWRLDAPGPGGVITDSGKRQMDGVFRLGSAGGPRPGVTGEALDFGRDGYVDFSEHLSMLGQLDSFTFTAWIRDPGENIGILFSLSDGTANNRVQLNLNRKNLAYLWQDQSPHWDSVAGRVDGWNPGQWYHVAVSVNRNGVRLYRDGQLIGSGSIGIQIGTPFQSLAGVHQPTQAYLGYISQGTAGQRLRPQRFAGVMDDVQLYAEALDAPAIRYLHDHPGEPWSTGVQQ